MVKMHISFVVKTPPVSKGKGRDDGRLWGYSYPAATRTYGVRAVGSVGDGVVSAVEARAAGDEGLGFSGRR